MSEDLLDISRKTVEDIEGVIRNLQDMGDLSSSSLAFHANALAAAEEALSGAKKLNESNEVQDAVALFRLLRDVNVRGDLSTLEQKAMQELEGVKRSADRIRSPQIDKDKIKQVLMDLEKEISQMKSAAVKKGVSLLATIARVAIPLL